MPHAIGTLGTVETLTIGGRTFTDLANIIEIGCTIPAVPNNVCGMFLPAVSPAQYQVTSGKTLTIGAMSVNMDANSASGTTLGYGDSATSVSGDTTTPSNPVLSSAAFYAPTALGAYGERGMSFKIPSQKYVFAVSGTGNAVVVAWGYEA